MVNGLSNNAAGDQKTASAIYRPKAASAWSFVSAILATGTIPGSQKRVHICESEPDTCMIPFPAFIFQTKPLGAANT